MIINSDGKRYRVAYTSFKTKDEALKYIETLKLTTKNKELWILNY